MGETDRKEAAVEKQQLDSEPEAVQLPEKKRPIDEEEKGDVKRAKSLKKNEETQEEKTQEDDTKDTETEENSAPRETNKNSDAIDEKTEKLESKFVFGARTTFGQASGFSMLSKKNVFEKQDDKDKDKTEEKKEAPKSVFGTGSTFGNAFQHAIGKKSIFDEPQESSAEPEDKEVSKEVYKKVHLEKQEVKSGEEEEETLFQVKAKLYHMDLTKVSDGWKEKGVGILKVNKFINPIKHYHARLVMRQDGILKLILNVPIVKGVEVFKGMASSLNSDKFIRVQVVEDSKPVQYAFKIGMVENSSKLYNVIEKLVKEVN
ncbi:hypothetical protein KL937_001274 [Ogataea polymorpha]|uniref:uncharacterized protein n=1 Tax=Ogataea polymorpha TaxID=460523 RepID=UPI0007F4AAAA|nr:uncharacterized protein OGAPODRAFT_76606 [Ogataea polymorpha]KAG7881651.1 hypothetical protein KL937_001274 [Ogataea polymorpha]KAG7893943.1 hypothetical protein KL908_002220 [Ogataea polymorpha]KAG7933443.1 hypothetical protein KL934_003253 [Ogataea polymorpha]KAG7938741.1 hypothetical protein KL904_001270 [Ogataea polymorpha]OBA15669.1 hypothetical protein OGAPODRAFT_76606 [Ogataea polymorpha]